MLLMYASRPATPSLTIFSGVAGKSFAVARLTDLSVACAESTTATRSSKGVPYLSSVLGCGLAARSRCSFPPPPARPPCASSPCALRELRVHDLSGRDLDPRAQIVVHLSLRQHLHVR